MRVKKVLMLTHPEMDHLAYMMYDGLYKILGKDNLSIYPFIKHYQGGTDDWHILDDGRRGYTPPIGYISKHDTIERSIDELINNISSFDIIYLSAIRSYALRALEKLIEKCGRNNLPPLVVSEGEDYQSLDTIRKIKNLYRPIIYFKRELTKKELDCNSDIFPLYPLPFSATTDDIPLDNPNKDIDVFAIFGNTYPIREKIVKLINSSDLTKNYNIRVNIDRFGDEPEKFPWYDQRRFETPPLMHRYEYLSLMARSKINIIARGWGNDTLRRFEASLFSGLVLCDNIPIITPFPFIDNQHIIYYSNDLSDLINRIKYYLNNHHERERIGISGRNHCLEYHTTTKRARYFLEMTEKHI